MQSFHESSRLQYFECSKNKNNDDDKVKAVTASKTTMSSSTTTTTTTVVPPPPAAAEVTNTILLKRLHGGSATELSDVFAPTGVAPAFCWVAAVGVLVVALIVGFVSRRGTQAVAAAWSNKKKERAKKTPLPRCRADQQVQHHYHHDGVVVENYGSMESEP